MALPTGPAVAFLFTDIEGSTRLERTVGSAAWAGLVRRHDEILRAAIEGQHGVVVKTEGDAFFAAFDAAIPAVTAAVAAQRSVATEPWPEGAVVKVRMGIHLGQGSLRSGGAAGDPEDYVGIDVNYAARIAAAGNGGQIVLSDPLVATLPRGLTRLTGLADVELVDVGPRAVKDFEDPVPLYRLVVPDAADDARPLRTTEVPSNLPGDVTSFVGREVEIDRVRDDLLASRIVTLAGPGGSGKTRLALAVAGQSRDRFPHGVWFVDLAALRDPDLLEPAIAVALDVRETPDRTASEALRAHLRERTVLLVLDNLEQLLPAVAGIVAGLVRAAPGLRTLVTSRELLRITGERGHPVPPLDGEGAVALFIDRARAQRSDFAATGESLAAIEEICRRLDGLPLAIELAAARVRLLGPVSILDRLGRSLDLGSGPRDTPERQRTLRGTFDWSYELLPVEERRLFSRLAVFAGSWTPAMAAAVADPDDDLDIDLVAGLESLADKSLVRVEPADDDASSGDGEGRFSLHPLLREYGLERLGDGKERSLAEARFAAVCVGVAEAAGQAMLGPTREASMRRLDRDDRNLRVTIDWAIASGEALLGLRLVGTIWRWYQARGRIREARSILADLLARPSHGDVQIRIAALSAEGGLAYWMNDFAAARAAYEERLDLASTTGDGILLADAHYDIGFLAMIEGDAEELRAQEQLALDLYQAGHRDDGVLRARQALVLGVFLTGDYAAALELEQLNLEAFRRTGAQYLIADSMTLQAGIYWRLGDPGTSWLHLQEALRYFHETDNASGHARVLGMAAIVLLADGDGELGARIAGATYRLVREKGVMLAPVKVLHLPDPADTATKRFGAVRAAELLAEGEAIPIDEMVAMVLAKPSPA
ncbi:MAG TPA: adenylate/guanylate cyclase domain-containing protein, partial [Candidatus Saccharimonadia bacterium]|nr:adenylate/guanylate cyclase domain-containing protein [Candidatus Saccharimonadia bacterium]